MASVSSKKRKVFWPPRRQPRGVIVRVNSEQILLFFWCQDRAPLPESFPQLKKEHTKVDASPMPSMTSIIPTMALRPRTATIFSLYPTTISSPSALRLTHPPRRHATLIRRPKRPYTFTQLVILSDGSTYLHRTTSPSPVYRSTKDTRNAPLWNPSSQKLLNVEADEAGRLRAFRAKFGRGWDARSAAQAVAEEGGKPEGDEGRELVVEEEQEDNLLDLITGYGGGQERTTMKSANDKKRQKVAEKNDEPPGSGKK